MELLDTRKGVLCYLQELPVHALVEHSGPQSSHFVFCIRDQYYLAYWQRGLQDLNDAILFSDNPQNMHGSQSGTHIRCDEFVILLISHINSQRCNLY